MTPSLVVQFGLNLVPELSATAQHFSATSPWPSPCCS
jgi:hypothetical protein